LSVWDQGDEEDGVSPFPLGVYPPDMPLDWAADGEEDEVLLLAILDASVAKRGCIRKQWLRAKRPKVEGRC
jgi:hypothetical protein